MGSSGQATGEGREIAVPKAQPKKKASKRVGRKPAKAKAAKPKAARAKATKAKVARKPARKAVRRRRRIPVAGLREQLLGERVRIQRELEEMQARTARRSKLDAAVEEQDFDDNPGDAATETLERGTDLALERTVHDILEQIEHSLAKIDDGTYGVCDSCGTDIPEPRLKALPYATLCLICQDRLERG